eukprot:361808-Chlamydomonas_euryale.AAC.12
MRSTRSLACAPTHLLFQLNLEAALVGVQRALVAPELILLQLQCELAVGLERRDVVLVLVQEVLYFLLVDLHITRQPYNSTWSAACWRHCTRSHPVHHAGWPSVCLRDVSTNVVHQRAGVSFRDKPIVIIGDPALLPPVCRHMQHASYVPYVAFPQTIRAEQPSQINACHVASALPPPSHALSSLLSAGVPAMLAPPRPASSKSCLPLRPAYAHQHNTQTHTRVHEWQRTLTST